MPARIVIVESKPNDYCIIMREILKMEFDPIIMKRIKELISENPNASPELLNYIEKPRMVKPFDPEEFDFYVFHGKYSINYTLENFIPLTVESALKHKSKEYIEQAIQRELKKFEGFKKQNQDINPLRLWLDDIDPYENDEQYFMTTAFDILEDLLTRPEMTVNVFQKHREVFEWGLDNGLNNIPPAFFTWFNPKDFGKGKIKPPFPLYTACSSPYLTASWFLNILSICKSIGRPINEIEALYLASNRMKKHPHWASSLLARSWRYKKLTRNLKSLKIADQFLTEKMNEDITSLVFSHF